MGVFRAEDAAVPLGRLTCNKNLKPLVTLKKNIQPLDSSVSLENGDMSSFVFSWTCAEFARGCTCLSSPLST